jgi:squalene-hopene/tetraprenyl-beta-curcumene cyclase
MSSTLQPDTPVLERAGSALSRAASSLAARRKPEGFWQGLLTADTTLESDWFLLLLWLHPPQGGRWTPPDPTRAARAVHSILARQNPDGGFPIYSHGPSDVSASVKAYFALKLMRAPAGTLDRLRARILAFGGLHAANSYVKINLSLFGLYPRALAPTVPPEMILLPGGFLYQMSSWTRAIVAPLSIVQASTARAPRPVPDGFTLSELIAGEPPAASLNPFTWKGLFRISDRLAKLWERIGPAGVRHASIERMKLWILARTAGSDGLGAIYPSMQYAIMALDALGYGPDSPERREAEQQFERLLTDEGEQFFFQPCFSPVWDTAIAAHALGRAGEQPCAATGDWLLARESRRRADWAVKRPSAEPSGWYFEFSNEHYPDIDDTAQVLLALASTGATDRDALAAATRRAIAWLKAMQSRDGGWAAFDADNDRHSLSEVPFADHNAMLDPTCADITGRVVEALSTWGEGQTEAVRRGVAYLRRTQTMEGSWRGRWGVNYVYGTYLALRGLRAAGLDENEPELQRGAEWLRSTQNADGGWGESCESYTRDEFVASPSTASQTAWGLLGLLAAGDLTSESTRRAVEFLLSTQRADGGWDETAATGTGFPGVFYLTYHLYRDSFPALALGEYTRALREAQA